LVHGILNGTCNFILTRMEETQLNFAEALREAQEHGYAEGDPSTDIDGFDAANKLSILSALAFGVAPDLAAVQVEGIRHVTPLDLRFAHDLGCCVRLLGVARSSDAGVEQRVGPSLVSLNSPLAGVKGPFNAVLLRGDFVGDLMLEGRGAGAEPTASAVVADLIDIARGHAIPALSLPAGQLKKSVKPTSTHPTRYYMRLQAVDKPGVVADISAILRDEAISIESLLQRGQSEIESVPLVITTHESDSEAMRRAVEKIARVPAIVEKPCVMQIEG
jgi:homoserine dehydrogenase